MLHTLATAFKGILTVRCYNTCITKNRNFNHPTIDLTKREIGLPLNFSYILYYKFKKLKLHKL